MKNLMEQCQKLDPPKTLDKRFINEDTVRRTEGAEQRGLSSLFSGVFPGTEYDDLLASSGTNHFYFDQAQNGVGQETSQHLTLILEPKNNWINVAGHMTYALLRWQG